MTTPRRGIQGYRLQDSAMTALIRDLLSRGARVKTVENMTDASENTIRGVFHELFNSSPARGPAAWATAAYVDSPLSTFSSTLAAIILRHVLSASEFDPSAEDKNHKQSLARLYITAYDLYIERIEVIVAVQTPLTFERFLALGVQLQREACLTLRHCTRCPNQFVASIEGKGALERRCAPCRIQSRRTCGCGAYVPIDHGDIPAVRSPKCFTCAGRRGSKRTLEAYKRAQARAMPASYDSLPIGDLATQSVAQT